MAEKKVQVIDIVTITGVNVGGGQEPWPKGTLKLGVEAEFARLLIGNNRARVATPEEVAAATKKPAAKKSDPATA